MDRQGFEPWVFRLQTDCDSWLRYKPLYILISHGEQCHPIVWRSTEPATPNGAPHSGHFMFFNTYPQLEHSLSVIVSPHTGQESIFAHLFILCTGRHLSNIHKVIYLAGSYPFDMFCLFQCLFIVYSIHNYRNQSRGLLLCWVVICSKHPSIVHTKREGFEPPWCEHQRFSRPSQ